VRSTSAKAERPQIMSNKGRPRVLKARGNTKYNIVLTLKVTVEQYKTLFQRAGGKGKISSYIRRTLGLESAGENSNG